MMTGNRGRADDQRVGLALHKKSSNPAHGSGRMVQALSINASPDPFLIPLTVVGGYFKSTLSKDLNNPPTAVGGIQCSSESFI